VQILDITNPSSPAFVGNYDSESNCSNVFVAGDTAYLSDWSNGFKMVDITDKANPQLIAGYNTPGITQEVCAFGDYMLVADYYSGMLFHFLQPSSVDENGNDRRPFALDQNYPNPFNSTTKISYSLSRSSDVTIDIYDIMGRRIAGMLDTHQQPGNYSVNWSPQNLPSGVYFYSLRAGDNQQIQKMMYLK
jgi:hypothetical protein